jgi:hypothetical protein
VLALLNFCCAVSSMELRFEEFHLWQMSLNKQI